MKILLSWLLDYLDCSIKDINVEALVHLFNTRTAEIETFERVVCEPEKMFLAQVTAVDKDKAFLGCLELGIDIELPCRADLVVGKTYLVVRQNDALWQWATLFGLSDENDGYFPAIWVSKKEIANGAWRSKIAPIDYVLEVDNKSINHRPDLWGHYGIAREVAAFLHIKLKPLDQVLAPLAVVAAEEALINHSGEVLSISIQDQSCFRFAALECKDVVFKDCPLWIAMRLMRVGTRLINGVVDLTNYVMFDVGHPMHVFDDRSFKNKEIVIRKAKNGETLQLLDGQVLKLTAQNLVVANNQHPVSLAGIMGGKDSGFVESSRNVILEAAGFDPVTIRKSAQYFKLRTEAFIRFEKYLDPMQNIVALKRFVYLAQKEEMLFGHQQSIISAGATLNPIVCLISHEFIEKRIGTTIQREFVVQTLQSLGFGVVVDDVLLSYRVTVPTYRATKDIGIQEDILEEIIRSYGFENITQQLPVRSIQPFSLGAVSNVARIKNYLAYGMAMHEVRDYLFYDTSFVNQLKLNMDQAVRVRNPLSENWTTLVTSLVPHLLKGVEQNAVDQDHVRLFEYNRIWSQDGATINEQKSLSGIVFDKKVVDFYSVKSDLQGLWDLCKLHVVWTKPQGFIPTWYDQHKVARLVVGDQCIGWAGMMSQEWKHDIVEGSAFIFELDGEFLELLVPGKQEFKAWSKYQDAVYDMSLLIPLSVVVDELKQEITQAHSLIYAVELVDFFEKEEWTDRRSVTFRYKMTNPERTMTKKDLEEIVESVTRVVKKYDAQVR